MVVHRAQNQGRVLARVAHPVVSCVDSRAIFRTDIGYYAGIQLWPLLKS